MIVGDYSNLDLDSVGFGWVGRNSKGSRLVYTYPSPRKYDVFGLFSFVRNNKETLAWSNEYFISNFIFGTPRIY